MKKKLNSRTFGSSDIKTFKRGIGVTFSTFFARDSVRYFLAENCLKGSLVKCLPKKVVRGNFVQIVPNFPAKSLGICTKKFSLHLFINLLKITFVMEENMIN